MKQVKLLFLLGLSLISATAFSMNLGRKLGGVARSAMPRFKAAAQAGASRVKATAQNAKVQAFPTFCKAVNVGIGTAPCVAGIYSAALATLDEEDTKQYLQDTMFKGGVEDVDEELAKFVRGNLTIPVFVGRADGLTERDLRVKLIKNAGGLTYLSAIKVIDLNCAAVAGRAIVMTSAMHTLLSSPELFVDAQEHELFCEWARAVGMHETGHCLEKHSYQKIAWKIAGPIAIHMAGKRMGPIAKRLLKMNPVAKTKKGVFARAVSGGIAKVKAASAGYLLLAKHHEYRADGWIDDAHKKYIIEMLYYQPGFKVLWRSKNPESYCECNEDSDLDSHPRPAKRIVCMCGSIKRGAELIVDAERQDQRRFYERRKAKMSTLTTQEEKIEFLIDLGYSQDVSTWEQTPEEAFKGEYDFVDEKIAWCLNENDPHWISLRNTVEQDLACAIAA